MDDIADVAVGTFFVLLIVAVVAAAWWTVCCATTEGTITDKQFVAEHSAIQVYWITTGKNQRIPVYQNVHYPDTYWILVEKDGKRGRWEVSKERYDSCSVGDYVKR